MSNFFSLALVCFIIASPLYAVTWSAPATLSGTDASSPRVAVDPSGNAIAVWSRLFSTQIVIQAATFNGTTWSPTLGETISDNALFSFAVKPRIGIDNSGNGVTIWHLFLPKIQAKRYVNGVWSSTPTDLDTTETVSLAGLDVAVNAPGSALAVWQHDATTLLSAVLIGGHWTSPIPLNTGTNPKNPEVGIDTSGKGVAVWEDSGSVYASSFSGGNSGTWSSPTLLSTAMPATIPQVAVNPLGEAVAVWLQNEVIYAASFIGGSWSSAMSLSGSPADKPQVDIDDSGNAVAVWEEGSVMSVINAARFVGGIWQAAMPISTATATKPQVALDPFGSGVAVWQRGDNVEAATLDFAGNWSSATQLNVSSTAIDPHVDIGGASERAVVVWEETGVIKAVTTLLPPAPPSNATGAQILNRFPAESEYFNQINWDASPSTSVISYLIRRNGALIASVPSTQLEYRNHLQQKNVPVLYAITASDGEQESTLITITVF